MENIGLKKLCNIYEKMEDTEKEKIIRFSEGLLTSQKIIDDEKEKYIGLNDEKNGKPCVNYS